MNSLQSSSETLSTDGRLVYAVGDIHGRRDLLGSIVRALLADMIAQSPAQQPVLVFLGDYVDRGTDSAGVVDFILQVRRSGAVQLRLLKGNHEEALLQFLDDPATGPAWVRHGGGATLQSYGVACPAFSASPEVWTAARDRFAAVLPPAHLQFYRDLEEVAVIGDYVFVHAGLRPGTPIDQQSTRDLLWIRDDFLHAKTPFEKFVIHGHTISETPERRPFRLGIDTGAFATGILTSVRLDERGQTIIQVNGAG